MSWCPKCKCEYQKGETVCAQCGGGLAAEEEHGRLGRQGSADEESQGKGGAAEEWDIPESDELQERLGRALGGGNPYQDNSQRASENRSAAWALLALGTVGLALIVLSVLEVIPFRLGSSYLFSGVMAAIFILFFVAGVVSMRNARSFAVRAESENSLKNTLRQWCADNLHSEEIDAAVGAAALEDSPEELYFARTGLIKARLNRQFVNLDQGFLDKFIDDCVYGLVFEESDQKQ